jgi:hypothetical protein
MSTLDYSERTYGLPSRVLAIFTRPANGACVWAVFLNLWNDHSGIWDGHSCIWDGQDYYY